MRTARSLIWAGAGVVLLLAGLGHADSKLKGWVTKVDPAAQTIEVAGQTVSTRDVRVTGGPLDVGAFATLDKGRIKVKPQRRPADDQVFQYPAKGQGNPGRAEFSHVRHFNALGAKQCATCHSPEMGLTASSSRAGGAASSALDPHAPQSIGHFCASCHDGTRRLSQAGILAGRADRVVFTSLRTADPQSCQRCHAPADHGRDFTAAHGDVAEHSGSKPCLGCHSLSWSAREQALHADFLAAEKALKANPDDPRAALVIGSENFCVNCHRADGKWR
jgi:hypothetical protein